MPAEEEKRKLYERAWARALKTQARAASAASGASGVGRSNSTLSATGSITSGIANPYASTSGRKGAAIPGSPPASIKQTSPLAQATFTPTLATPPASDEEEAFYDRNDSTSEDEDEELNPALDALMADRPPLNITGHVVIPDYRQPVHGGLAVVYRGLFNGLPVTFRFKFGPGSC
jgi:hypothetical protein